MARPRLQFRLSTLLWLTLAVGCFFGGREFHRRWETPRPPSVASEWIIREIPLDDSAANGTGTPESLLPDSAAQDAGDGQSSQTGGLAGEPVDGL
jgi:hypothetical protein